MLDLRCIGFEDTDNLEPNIDQLTLTDVVLAVAVSALSPMPRYLPILVRLVVVSLFREPGLQESPAARSRHDRRGRLYNKNARIKKSIPHVLQRRRRQLCVVGGRERRPGDGERDLQLAAPVPDAGEHSDVVQGH